MDHDGPIRLAPWRPLHGTADTHSANVCTQSSMNASDYIASFRENAHSEPPLKVIIVYNDAAAGHRAIGVLLRLAACSAEPIRVDPILYRFELLDDPHWREAAATDAVECDMIILSTSAADELPESINEWAKASLARRGAASTAMLTLFGSQDAWAVWIQDESHLHTRCQSSALHTQQAHDEGTIAACA